MGEPPPPPRSLYTARRSPLRTAALVGGMVIVIAAVAAIVVSALGGSSKGSTLDAATSTAAHAGAKHSGKHASKRGTRQRTVAPSSETSVTVLNATEANGLAHRTAEELQNDGYPLASAQSGRPPGSGQVSLVEYAGGHKPEAEGVAHALTITHVLPMESGVSALSGSASVVVIVGADRAALEQ